MGSTNVAPGATVAYEIYGTLSADNQGLAGFCLDLLADPDVVPAQASPGPALGTAFSTSGFTNLDGFGGTVASHDLLGIGGAQNTIGNDGQSPNPPLPAGTVVPNLAVGAEVLLASGSLTMPQTAGTYTVSLANACATVITDATSSPCPAAAATVVLDTGSFQATVVSLPGHTLSRRPAAVPGWLCDDPGSHRPGHRPTMKSAWIQAPTPSPSPSRQTSPLATVQPAGHGPADTDRDRRCQGLGPDRSCPPAAT